MKRWGKVLRGAAWSRKLLIFLTVNAALLSPAFLRAQSCELYPIALSAQTLSNVAPGTVVNIFNGSQPGNFGWLSWAGSPSEPTLVKSLTPPGDSSTYVNPDAPTDHQVSVGDWVQSKPGVSNSKNVRDALDGLESLDITIPIWDQARGQGEHATYHVAGFARVRLVSYQLPGQNQISARFLGYATCGGQNLAPVVDAGPDLTSAVHDLPAVVALNGSVSDDGLPIGGTLTSTWRMVSGPGSVTFGDIHAATTTATFSATGLYLLQLAASDSSLSSTDTVVVAINRQNQPPQGFPQTITIDEDTSTNIVLTGSDPDGDPLSFIVVDLPQHGTLSGTPPSLTYTPNQDYNGTDAFTFKAFDGQLDSAVVSVSITLNPVNDAPFADSQTLTNFEDTPMAITLSGSDVEGSPLTYTLVSYPTNGTLTGVAPNLTYTPATNYFGTDAFSFKVNDGTNDSAPATVLLTILPVDDAPIVDAGPDQFIILPTNTVTLAGSVEFDSFPGSLQTLDWSQVSGPPGTAFASPSNTTASVSFTQSGVYVFRLTASDSFLSSSDDVVVTVDAPPMVDAGPNQTNTLPGTVTLQGVASDDGIPTNGALTISWSTVSGPGSVVFDDATLTNTSASFSDSGVYVLRLTANDGAASASSDVAVLINRAPVVDAGADQIVTNLQATLNGTAFDDGFPAGNLVTTWSEVSGPGSVTFSPAATTNSQPTTTATFGATGVYVLRLTADDSLASRTADVTVFVDAAPIVTASNNLIVNLPGTAALTATVSDDGIPTGSVVTQLWSQVSGPGTVAFANASALSTTASFSTSGVYVVQFQASDTLLTTVSNVTVIVNQKPFVDAGPDQVVSLTTGAGLHGSVSDDGIPLGVPLVLEWVKVSGPGVVHFGNINAVDSTATFSVPGIYTLELVASDTIASSSDTMSITVTPPGVNQPPSVYAGPNQTIGGTNLAKLAGVVTDDNFFGTNFLYSWWTVASGPGTVSFANSNSPASTATFSTAGAYVLTLSATDGQYTNSSQVTITIYPTNQPPTVDPGPNQSISTSIATMAGQVHDDGLPQGVTLTAHWSQVSGPGAAFFAVPSYARTTVSFPQPGTYVLQLTASDTQYTVSSNVTITVQFNQPPVVNAGTDQEIVNTNVAALRGQASDDGLPTGSTLTNTWSLVNGPSTATFGNIHATNTTVTFGDQGAYQIRLTATDGQLTSFDDVTIIVASSNSIPYQATNVLYRFVQAPSTNFFVTNLDESTYTNGQAGFGNFGSCPLNNATFIHTIWPGLSGNAQYLLIRKHFFVPPGTTNLDMGFTVDNNALIYINGVLITPTNIHQLIINNGSNSRFNSTTHYWDHDNCPAYNDLVLSGISTNIWSPGNNLLTVQVFDDGGQAFYDNRISPNAPTSVLLNKAPIPQVNTNVFVVYPSMATLAAVIQDDGLPLNGTKVATWSMVNGPGTVTFSRPSASFAISNDVSTLAAFSAQGTYTLMLQANDSDLTGAAIVRVTVSSVSNQPPVVSAGSDQTVALGDSAALNGTATDDGFPFGTLSTFWSFASGPGNVYFSTLDGTNYAAFDAAGDYVLQFNANDGATTSSATITIHVLPPVSRSLRISTLYPPQTDVSIGADLSGQVYDDGLPPGSMLTVQWTTVSGPAVAIFSQTSNNFPAVFAHADFTAAGNYVLRLTASDGQLTASADMPITVTDLYSGNRAPVVDAGPATSATTGTPIVLHGSANDDGRPVGSTLATLWTQLSGPGSVLFADPTVTNTTATFSAEGVYVLRLIATDGQLTNSADVTVIVTGQPLIVYAGPDATTFRQIALKLVGIVLDGTTTSNLNFQWGKISGPGTVTFTTVSNTTLNATTWLPVVNSAAAAQATFNASGTYVLQLAATDSHITNADTLTVTVSDGTNTAPVVSAGPPQTILLQSSAALHPTITDDGLPNGTLTVTWQKVSGPGTVTFSKVSGNFYAAFTQSGVYDLRLIVSDGELSGSNDVVITVADAVPQPDVAIFAPLDGAIVTAPTNIIGTASSPILASYVVRYRLAPPGEDTSIPVDNNGWTTLTTGSTSVVSNALAVLDPTMLLNGIYEIQVIATDSLGRSAYSEVTTVRVDRNLKIGQFTLSFEDLNVPVAGVPIEIVRTYDSRDQRTNDFGVGWSIDVRNVRLQKNRNLGPAWFEDTTGGIFPSYFIDSVNDRDLTVTLANGREFKFTATFSPESQFGIPIESGNVIYKPTSDTYAKLESIRGDDVLVSGDIPGVVDLFDVETGGFFNPTLFKMTTEEGEVYIIDENEGLKSLTDRNGNTLLISTNGVVWTNVVTGGASVGVTFVRDPQGRISKIIDPQGNALNYTYGTNGSLATFTDRETNVMTFAYTNVAFPHYLTGITDPRGVQAIRTEYDSNGRMIRQSDAAGNVINFTNDLSNNREIVRDRLGNVTIHEYDQDGNITRTTDPLGNITMSKYDINDNLLEQVDALGNTNSYTYDSKGNKLTQTDPLGFTTRYTYARFRTLTSITNPRGFTTTNSYDPNSGQLLQESDPLGNVTSYSYDGDGNLLFRTDALGNVTSNRYDSLGHMTSTAVIDPVRGVINSTSFTYDTNGNQLSKLSTRTTPHGPEVLTTSYVYDKQNRLLETINPDGSTNITIYAIGLNNKPAVEIDSLGRQTLHYYDERGNLTNTVYADDTSESFRYDAENRQIQTIDRAGRATSFTNDPLGRLTISVYPDSSGDTNYYDGVGRVIAKGDARGNTAFFGFDAAGRDVAVTNALGEVTRYEYDQSGNRIATIDALGRTNRIVFDALNRPAQTVFADGSTQITSFDALGRRVSQQDQAGKVIAFAYDGLGRLAAVTNALGYVTTYAYDELGQQVSQTDANNHATTYEYDSMGRRVKRTLPGNQVETYAYDAAGLLTNRTDFNGFSTSYQYDTLNRLITKIPDPRRGEPSITFRYNTLGLRTNMTDASGSTVYAYDNRNRLVQKTKSWTGSAIGVSLNYAYDLAGNLTNVVSSDTNGVNVGYAYDELNRLAAVDDVRLGVTAYNYDNVGDLQGCTYPNFFHAEYQYDPLNRLTNLSSDRLGTAIANYVYKVAAAGNRTNAAEQMFSSALNASAKTINHVYTYDSMYQLTGESINGTLGAGSAGYGYDPVGNRLSRGITSLPLSSQSFGFDANDRLNTDTYDPNGNTLMGAGFGQFMADEYDFENRLITRHTPSCTVHIAYDGDGNRVSKTLTTATNNITTFYVVDEVNPSGYAEVLEEHVSLNSQPSTINCVYTCGHSLISQERFNGSQWVPSFYGYDGHNNVRYLIDTSANVTDTYDYDAFGNLIARSGSTANNYLFSGEQYDADLGLYYLRARYQNTDTGRFWTQDSYEGEKFDPSSLHKYLYVENNPVNRIDPSGQIATAEEFSFASALSAAIDQTFAVIGIAIYGVHYAGRDYTVYSCWGVDPRYGWGHAFMAVLRSDGSGGWRYDLWPKSQSIYVRAVRNPWSIFEGLVEKESVAGIPGGIPVAKFNPGNLAIWESVIQLQALSLELRPDQFSTPFPYSYYLVDCYEWTLGATAVAIPISLLPFPNTFGHFF